MTKKLAVVFALAACAVVAVAGAKVRKLEPREVAEMQASRRAGRVVPRLPSAKEATPSGRSCSLDVHGSGGDVRMTVCRWRDIGQLHPLLGSEPVAQRADCLPQPTQW